MDQSSTVDVSTEVLVVGAGPTGLTLACELARAGVGCRIIDAAEAPQPGSRGKGLQPRSLEVFDDLGIVERVIAHGRMPMPILAIAPDGQATVTGTDTLGERPDVPYPTTLLTPQWRVEEALRMRLAAFGKTVELGTRLESFTQANGSVTAVLTREQSGSSEVVTARWLVGCDGGHSTVRKLAGISFEGETLEDIRMILADLAVDGLGRDAWVAWRHPDGLVSLCPLPSTDLFQFQANVPPGGDPTLGLANMQAILEHRSGRTDIRLHAPRWTSLWRANVRIVDRYREGNVLVAGDAAHIHSPAGGQGMNTGIQDAHNLGWKLAAVANGAPPALVDTYEAERRPVALGVLSLSNARMRQALENKAIPTTRDMTTTQLGIHYRGSPLARDDRDESAVLRAGDRAPDARGLVGSGGERRLFDLTRGGRFTLLSFGAGTAPELSRFGVRTFRVVSEPAGPEDVCDTTGQLAASYGAVAGTLCLIRPDGHVGLISDAGDSSAVASYLAAVS